MELVELFLDPATYAALATLIVIEVVLGIDNLIFIAILADKLSPEQRGRARVVGLSLALIMRILLLTLISWLSGLTESLFSVAQFDFSARDLIMLAGGLFLIYKATTELHERLDGGEQHLQTNREYASFWTVVIQIVVLDAVFSIDAVITAVGMVNQLPIMILAVCIAIGLMLLAAKPLMDFVSKHQTVVVLCLGFLLLIGLSLLAEGFSFFIPKGYLYAAIGFSIIIEFFNQIARHNRKKTERHKPLRLRTAQAILRLMGENAATPLLATGISEEKNSDNTAQFVSEEVNMVSRVLTLSERTVKSIMTHRSDVMYIDLDDTSEEQKQALLEGDYNVVPVCKDGLDEVIGVGYASHLLSDLIKHNAIQRSNLASPIIVPETMRVMSTLKLLRDSTPPFILVTDEYGTIEGVITAVDVFEAVAGDMIEEGEPPAMQKVNDNSWLMAGTVDVHLLESILDIPDLVSETNDYTSLAGFMLAQLERLPEKGDFFTHEGYSFTVEKIAERRIAQVLVERLKQEEET